MVGLRGEGGDAEIVVAGANAAPDAATGLPNPAKTPVTRLALRSRPADVGVMQNHMNQLCALVHKHAATDNARMPIPRLRMLVGTEPTRRLPGMSEAMMCFVLQGAKRVTIGSRTFEYGGASFLLASVDLPSTGQIVQASADQPYMAIVLAIDPAAIAALLLDMPPQPEGETMPGFTINALTVELAEPLLRLVRLLDTPGEIGVLAPMIERELLYRILQGPQAAMLRQIGRSDSRLSQVRRSIDWIRLHFTEPFNVAQLASLAGMSASSFHRHFKAVTSMSPLQYQKQIRLQEARRRLLSSPGDAARVAFAVGYESASQFSREYSRQFGLPPSRDAARVLVSRAFEDA